MQNIPQYQPHFKYIIYVVNKFIEPKKIPYFEPYILWTLYKLDRSSQTVLQTVGWRPDL